MGKNQKKKGGPSINSIVYSTHPEGNSFFDEIRIDTNDDTYSASSQELRVYRDKKQRKGKVVTVIIGFKGKQSVLEEMGKTLKSKFGVGGSVKDDQVILQGDFCDKVVEWLKGEGYKNTKRTGG
jgi:translation initiation factor 1